MRVILFSRPDLFEGEADMIIAMMERGLETLHLRKPDAADERIEELLRAIPPRLRNRIVLHSAFPLAERYGLRGIHLNSRHPLPPVGYRGQISRSCHSLEEVERCKGECDYVTLSPIFDSISKQGYTAGFTPDELTEAASQGIIGERVIALGGITPERMAAVRAWHFGGVALLGYLWQDPTPEGVVARLKRIRTV